MDDGSGWMGRLAPLRDELLRGDLRPLYLGWLASAGGLDDDALEPEPPAGLSDLTHSQQALAEFIEIDPDLLAAAATGSPRAAPIDSAQAAAIDAWLTGWSREEMAPGRVAGSPWHCMACLRSDGCPRGLAVIIEH